MSFRQACVGRDIYRSGRLLLLVVSRSDSDEYLVPFVVLAGFGLTATGKVAVEHLDIGDQRLFHPSPVGQLLAAESANLISEQFDYAVVDPVVMRLDDALAIFVHQPNQMPLLDRRPQLRDDVRIVFRRHALVLVITCFPVSAAPTFRPIFSRRAISDLLTPARYSLRTCFA